MIKLTITCYLVLLVLSYAFGDLVKATCSDNPEWAPLCKHLKKVGKCSMAKKEWIEQNCPCICAGAFPGMELEVSQQVGKLKIMFKSALPKCRIKLRDFHQCAALLPTFISWMEDVGM